VGQHVSARAQRRAEHPPIHLATDVHTIPVPHGHYDDNRYPITDWTFAPVDYAKRIAQSAMPVHMNLWLLAAPSDRKPVEVVVHRFSYTP
jgi:hypothetical protein